jgi:hypothetical protein
MDARLRAPALGWLIALAVAAPAAAETTTIGQVAPAGGSGGTRCFACTDFQLGTATGSPTYAVPAGNWRRLVFWQIRGGAKNKGHAALRTFRPTATQDRYRLVGQSAEGTVPVERVSRFRANVPVQRGDLLGLRTGEFPGDIRPSYESNSSDDVVAQVLGDPVIGDTVGPGGDNEFTFSPSFLVNVSATLYRPPPETTITKHPPAETESHAARFRFRADAPRQEFQCRLGEGRRFKACDSPRRYRDLARGRHLFQVRAIAGGVQDPTPAGYTWRVAP